MTKEHISREELDKRMEVKRFTGRIVPRWVVDGQNIGDPFATPQEMKRRAENRDRVEKRKRRTEFLNPT